MDDWEVLFQRKTERIRQNGQFNSKSKAAVLEYLRVKQGQGVGPHRLLRVVDFLWHLLEGFRIDLTKTTQSQVEGMAIWVNGKKEWKDWTKYSYLSILKNFLSWLDEQYGLGLRLRIKLRPPKNAMMPEHLLTEDEINRLLNATDDLQTRLLIGIVMSRERG